MSPERKGSATGGGGGGVSMILIFLSDCFN